LAPPEGRFHDPSGPHTVRRPAVSGPSDDVASGSHGRPSFASGPESRGSASASDCSVGTSSSSWVPFSRCSQSGHHIRTNSKA
jgi:hypothetical protein